MCKETVRVGCNRFSFLCDTALQNAMHHAFNVISNDEFLNRFSLQISTINLTITEHRIRKEIVGAEGFTGEFDSV